MPTVAVYAVDLARLVRTVEAVAAQVEGLTLQVHRAEATLRSKVSAPVHTLSVGECVKLHGCSEKTIRRLLARQVFTDSRGGRRSGSEWRIFADEFELWRTDGPQAVARFRERMGRT